MNQIYIVRNNRELKDFFLNFQTEFYKGWTMEEIQKVDFSRQQLWSLPAYFRIRPDGKAVPYSTNSRPEDEVKEFYYHHYDDVIFKEWQAAELELE